MRVRGAIAAVFVIPLASVFEPEARAEAPPCTARLEFVREKGAERCIDEPGFKTKVEKNIPGAEPWRNDAALVLRVRFSVQKGLFVGTIDPVTNGIHGDRVNKDDGKGRDCAELAETLATEAAAIIKPLHKKCAAPPANLPRVTMISRVFQEPEETPEIARVEVLLSTSSESPVTVSVRADEGSATAGDDYSFREQVVTFSPGDRSELVEIELRPDPDIEPPENFWMKVSDVKGAELVSGTSWPMTIEDPRFVRPLISVENVLAEERRRPREVTFVVKLTPAHPHDEVSVLVETVDGSAKAGERYVPVGSTKLVFAPLQTEQLVRVAVLGEARPEDETFRLRLSDASANALLGTPSEAVATIRGRRPPPPPPPLPVYAGTDGGYLFWSGGTKGKDQGNQSLVLSGSVVAGGETPVRGKYTLDIGMVGLGAAKRDTRYRTSFERLAPRTGEPGKKYFVNETITAFGLRGALRRDEADTSVSIGLFAGNWFQDGCRESRRSESAGDPICGSFEQWVVVPTFGLRMGPPTGPYVRLGFLDGRFLASDIGHLTVGARLPRDVQVEIGAVAAYDGVGSKIELLVPLGEDSRTVIAPMVASGVPWTVFDPTIDGTGTGSWFRAGVIFAMRR